MTSNAAPPPVLFPDVEATLIGALDVDAPVSVEVPNPRPERFVRIFRTGGTVPNPIMDRAQVTVECWASTTVQAAALAAQVRARLHALQGTASDGVWIARVAEMGGPQNLPDPTTDQPRYTFTVQADLRGQQL